MYESGKLMELNINDILPNRFQPRIYFNEGKLSQLAESIHKYGVIQPIVVRQVNNKYEIIAGERRYKASKLANKQTIPAIIVNLTDRESEEIALLENIQRQELTPIEEAVSYKRILDMGYITQEALAKKIGKAQSTIANKVRLLNLDDEVQEALLYGKISERHARSLLKINNRSQQRDMLKRIINERLTVKRTDEEIAKLLSTSVTPSNEVESLFDNNMVNNNIRKEDNMDIDKIMREAKDINVPEEPNDVSKLMQNPNAVYNQAPQTQTPEPVMPTVQENPLSGNKFVHYAPEEPTPAPVQTEQSHANFNSMFHPTASDLQPSASSANNIQTPVQTPQVNPAPVQNNVEPVITEAPSESTYNNPTFTEPSPVASAVTAAFNVAENSAPQPNPYQTPVQPVYSQPTPSYEPVTSVPEPVNTSPIYNSQNVYNEPVGVNTYTAPSISVENAIEKPTIPSADIYEEPVSQPSMVSTPVKTVNSPNLTEAIHLIRNCANQIEALGLKINVDEMDLDNNYKVTFEITK